MTEDKAHDRHHRLLHTVTERLTEHHHNGDSLEEDVTEAEESAGFDVDTDLAQPHPHPGAAPFDLTKDLSYGPTPDQS
ncbi:MAG TPA: hypothetical protein VGD34_13680 [Kribbella sp.]|jgi:hypothetical protein